MQPIKLEAGQSIIVEAVGDRYTVFEGYKDEEIGETRIGLSYAKLCQSVSVGNRILLADGSISIRVEEILSPTELKVRLQHLFARSVTVAPRALWACAVKTLDGRGSVLAIWHVSAQMGCARPTHPLYRALC